MAPYFSAYQTFTVDPTSGTVSQTVLVEEYASGNCGSIPGCPNATHCTGTAKYCYNLPYVNKTVYDYSVNNWCMLATTTGANYDGKYVWDIWPITLCRTGVCSLAVFDWLKERRGSVLSV